ncbi:S8 family serine peptidase [Propionibacteriaceae bacterium Y1700]|uniref:S8 family serine peptidase n=1 Tax=Microlunatus sp. Y1700 TaxID=3418487 RepID=UPI003DA705AD
MPTWSRWSFSLFAAGLVVALAVPSGLAQAAPTPTPTPTPSPSTPAPSTPAPSTPSPSTPPTEVVDQVIVKFRSGTTGESRRRTLNRAEQRTRTELSERQELATGARVVDSDGRDAEVVARELNAQPDVEYAVPNIRLQRTATVPDPRFDEQWDLQAQNPGLNIPKAWDTGRGQGAVVAVVDTGRTAHPELAGQFVGGYDFISDAPYARDGNGRDSNAQDEGDWLSGTSADLDCTGEPKEPSSWHGTHVAGTIAAKSDNAGIAGVAPRARIVPVRVLGLCGGLLSDIIDGMVWAAGGRVAGVPANKNPARVVNLSLGAVAPCDNAMQAAINAVRRHNALPVIAAGNSAADVNTFTPANCRGAFTVAALSKQGGRASYSNHGSKVALAAPGGDRTGQILSTVNGGTERPTDTHTYALASGTSMAAPHVAGVAALTLSRNPGLTVDDLHNILLNSTDPFLKSCGGCGRGMLDAATAMSKTPAPLLHTPHLDVSPSNVAAIRTSDGKVWAFSRAGSQIWFRTQARTGATWTGWQAIAGAVTSSPAVVTHDGRTIDLFVRGPKNQLLHTYTSNGRFVGYRDRGGRITSAPAAASLGNGLIDVFARAGSADGLYRIGSTKGRWGGWQNLGGSRLTTAPAAVADKAAGRMRVEARGPSGPIWGIHVNRTTVVKAWHGYATQTRYTTSFANPGPTSHWLTTSLVRQPVLRTGTNRIIDGRSATGGAAVVQHSDGNTMVLMRSSGDALWCWESRTGRWTSLGGTLN